MSVISITAAVFACQVVVCDVSGCGNILSPSDMWIEIAENIEARFVDCEHAELRRADEPDRVWFIGAAIGSYGFNDTLKQMTVYRKGR